MNLGRFGLRRANRRRRKAAEARFVMPPLDWRRLAGAGAALTLVAGFAWWLTDALDQPVRKIVVTGNFQRVAAVEVEQVLRTTLAGGFLSANLGELRSAIEGMTWVDRARLQRRWPDTLAVEVIEQQVAARWGEDSVVNTRGELFVSGLALMPAELPRLNGPEGSEALVAQRYLAIQERLGHQGLRLKALTLDERGAWEMELTNGVLVRLGRNQVDQRTERFIRVASQVIAGRAAEVSHVDMRYSNGFSIGWRNGAGAAMATQAEDPDTDA
ncbi:MAG: cell division protein FtsQ/DivIB [Steroidobacteraceae bacterium]